MESANPEGPETEQQNKAPSPFRTWIKLHREKVKHVGLHEWLMVLATIAMAGSTITYTHYASGQLEAMRGQLGEMKSSRIDNHELAIFAEKQAEQSLKASIEVSRNDQRAWVGQTDILPPVFTDGGKAVYFKDGERTRFTVFIVNSGKSPAKNVAQSTSYRTLGSKIKFSPRYPGESDNRGVIQPGLRLALNPPETNRATRQMIETYASGENVLYLYGRITYDDIFDRPHQTTFCVYLLRDLANFTDCTTYNDAN
jgi:hypothetical protein